VRSQPAGGDRFADRGFERSYDRGYGGDRRGGYGSSSSSGHGGGFGGRGGGGGGRFPRDPNPFEEKEFLERVEQGINLYDLFS
jgi:hypothetical protein